MQVDLVVRVAGRLAVALHEDLALGVPQRKPRGGALGVDLRHQPPVGVRVDLEEGDFARGERAGLGSAQLDLGGDGGEGVTRRTRQQRAVLEPGHTQAEPMSPVVQQRSRGPEERGPGSRGSEKPVGEHGGLSASWCLTLPQARLNGSKPPCARPELRTSTGGGSAGAPGR